MQYSSANAISVTEKGVVGEPCIAHWENDTQILVGKFIRKKPLERQA
jgi:hypothetical protein